MTKRKSKSKEEETPFEVTIEEPFDDELPFEPPQEEFKKGRLNNPDDIKEYLLAGNAHVTLVSKTSGDRYTYRVRAVTASNNGSSTSPVTHFVSVLTRPDNEQGYDYIGHVADYTRGDGLTFIHGKKSNISSDAKSVVAFTWFFQKVILEKKLSAALEVWHEGRCGRCGRKLTVPSSIEKGIGPECAMK